MRKETATEKLPRIKFADCKVGDYVISPDCTCAFEIERRRDGLVDGEKVKTTQMRCCWAGEESPYSVGAIVVDYFKTDFCGAFNKRTIDRLVGVLG